MAEAEHSYAGEWERKHEFQQPPRLPPFSGEERDTPLEVFLYDVACLQGEGVSEKAILQAIRRAVKGEAALTLLNLGEHTTVDSVSDKFKAVFGKAETPRDVVASFYSLRQENEDVGAFARRLETKLRKCIELERVDPEDADLMLCEAMRAGVLPAIKDKAAYELNTIKTFDELRVALRKVEADLPRQGRVRSATAETMLEAKVAELTVNVQKLLERTPSDLPRGRQQQQHQRQQQKHQPPQQPRVGQPQSMSWPNSQLRRLQNNPFQPSPPQQQQHQQQQLIQCFRCGQTGHIARGCRNPQRSPPATLNGFRPATTGQPQVSRNFNNAQQPRRF